MHEVYAYYYYNFLSLSLPLTLDVFFFIFRFYFSVFMIWPYNTVCVRCGGQPGVKSQRHHQECAISSMTATINKSLVAAAAAKCFPRVCVRA